MVRVVDVVVETEDERVLPAGLVQRVPRGLVQREGRGRVPRPFYTVPGVTYYA